MARSTIFHEHTEETTVQMPRQWLIYNHPHVHLVQPNGYKGIGYSDYEYNLMWRLLRALKGYNAGAEESVAFIGLGPSIGPALLKLALFDDIDVFEIDSQVIRFVEQEHPEYLTGLNIIEGDFVDTIQGNYDWIIFDVSLPEDITDEHKAAMSSHLKPGGRILTQPDWKELEL